MHVLSQQTQNAEQRKNINDGPLLQRNTCRVTATVHNMRLMKEVCQLSCLLLCVHLASSTCWLLEPAPEGLRWRRQVVQPTWLMRNDLFNERPAEVRVTPQNLQEASDIRSSIQKAVNDGTYAVASSPKHFQATLQKLGLRNWSSFQLPQLMWPTLPSWPNLLGSQQYLIFA